MLTIENLHRELHENILPFWMTRMVDKKNGGFYGRVDGNNKLHPKADKGVILNTRILWSFSAVYMKSNDPKYLDMATRAYQYILDHFIDYTFGGVFWSVDYKGKPSDKKKQIYAQAFAIYAFAQFYRATENKQALQLAKDFFKLIEKFSYDKAKGGYLEAFSRKWKVRDDLRLSKKDENTAKTMNTHLHILEAYTNLFRVWKKDSLQSKLKNLIALFLKRIIDKDRHFGLFFDEKWNVKSDKISFGHDIEGGWLLFEAAQVLGKEKYKKKCKKNALKMTNAALEGLDKDGGLMYEANTQGMIDTDKHWWPQAEALVGLINAWQISGDDSYKSHAENVWSFIQNHLVDQQEGEWHWMTNQSAEVIHNEDKAGPWKAPYHNSRAMLELMSRLKAKHI